MPLVSILFLVYGLIFLYLQSETETKKGKETTYHHVTRFTLSDALEQVSTKSAGTEYQNK